MSIDKKKIQEEIITASSRFFFVWIVMFVGWLIMKIRYLAKLRNNKR